MLQNIFQLNIWNVNLSLDLDQIKKEINTIVKLDKGRVISNQGGYQSNNVKIEKFVQLSFLKEIIVRNTIEYKKNLGLKTEYEFNRFKKGTNVFVLFGNNSDGGININNEFIESSENTSVIFKSDDQLKFVFPVKDKITPFILLNYS